MLCCASTCSVAVSNKVAPAINFVLSDVTEMVVERLVTVRLRSTVPEAASYTNTTLLAAVGPFTPIIKRPSGVAVRRLRYET